MEASACYCGDLDPCRILNSKRRKARKEHACECCGETIQKGQLYVCIDALFDESWWSGKRCIQCDRIVEDYCCGVMGEDAAWEWIRETLGVDMRTGEVMEE